MVEDLSGYDFTLREEVKVAAAGQDDVRGDDVQPQGEETEVGQADVDVSSDEESLSSLTSELSSLSNDGEEAWKAPVQSPMQSEIWLLERKVEMLRQELDEAVIALNDARKRVQN